MKIALIADIDTIDVFKIGGLEYTFEINQPLEGQKIIKKLLKKKEFAILIITKEIIAANRQIVNEIITKHEFPLIIPIPRIGTPSELSIDLIKDMIQAKLGIELK